MKAYRRVLLVLSCVCAVCLSIGWRALAADAEAERAPQVLLAEVRALVLAAKVQLSFDQIASLKGISEKTQVVIITHNRLTVERADVVFGVTAEQPGISTLVSVSLADYRGRAEPVTAS